MKDMKLFDILENAENNSMDRLIDKCPEISDKQLDKILAMSEKKYKMKKKGLRSTMSENVIKMNGNDFVEGVEHSRRPAWLAPLSIAASVVLVAGIAIGSTVFMKKNNKKSDNDHVIVPGVTVTTSTVKDTVTITTAKNGKVVTSVVTVPSSETGTMAADAEVTTSIEPVVSNETWDVVDLAGDWQYQTASDSNTLEYNPDTNGYVTINTDSTYVYYSDDGKLVSSGNIITGYEEIGGTRHKTISFYNGGSEFGFGGYYDGNDVDVISLGNGGTARLVRGNYMVSPSNSAFVGKWTYQVSPDGVTSVDQKSSYNGMIEIYPGGVYKYTNPYGDVTEGAARVGYEKIDGVRRTTIDFYYNTEFYFGGYYDPSNPDVITIGNGGMSRLIRSEDTNEIYNGDSFIGSWSRGRCGIEITKNGDKYDVVIQWAGSAQDGSEWHYTCYYDEGSGFLVSEATGVKKYITYSAEGSTEEIKYTEGRAKFAIDDGLLVWQDLDEHVADGMMFELY
ncbi:MAG: hypothetical protein II729_01330 [Ruminococcus sp.]|nr:hypothetical protein [Ruminococcus sp.]